MTERKMNIERNLATFICLLHAINTQAANIVRYLTRSLKLRTKTDDVKVEKVVSIGRFRRLSPTDI